MANLLIAIPTFNEAKNIGRVLDELTPLNLTILVVDDGSSDETASIARRYPGVQLLQHQVNQGYGQSLIDAFEFARRNGLDWVITMDADGQHEVDSIRDFVREIESDQWDLISGSRYLAARGNDDLPPEERRNVNFQVTRILNDLFGMELTDSFCGFKAHRTRSMTDLRLTEAGYAFPLQLWPRVWEAKLRMKEIPVRRIYNDPNRTFGVKLDDPSIRLRHYIDVLNTELHRLGIGLIDPESDTLHRKPSEQSLPQSACCGCC